MSFTDPYRHRLALDRGALPGHLTIEIGHETTKTGQVVQVEGVTGGRAARAVLEVAFDLAGKMRFREPTSPGWWVAIVAVAGHQFGKTKVQRSSEALVGDVHVILRVEPRKGLLNDMPDWPCARLSPNGPWLDLRGETALGCGPGITDVRSFLARRRADLAPDEWTTMDEDAVVRAFDLGVLEWEAGEVKPGFRRRLVRAQA